MKRAVFFSAIMFIGIALSFPQAILAQTASPSAKPKPAATESAQLNELKERLATKVAELRTVVKKAVYGTIKAVSITSATIETKTKDIKIELTDDVSVTQMISGKRTALTSEDLEARDNITVFGTYDETLDLLKARAIFIESPTVTVRVSGTIADIDEEEFTLTINTKEGRTVTVDIERTTKTTAWSKEGGIVKGGFSKITVGDTAHIVGTNVPKTENRIKASRVLDLGNITGAKSAPTEAPAPTASASATRKPTPRPTAADEP